MWFLTGTATLVIATAVSSTEIRRLTRAGRLQLRAVIVGGGPLAESLITALDQTGGNELKILGIFDDRADDRSPRASVATRSSATCPISSTSRVSPRWIW